MTQLQAILAVSMIGFLAMGQPVAAQTQQQPPQTSPGGAQNQAGMGMGKGQMGMGMMGMGGMRAGSASQGSMTQGGMGMMSRMMGMDMMEMGQSPAPQMQPNTQPGMQMPMGPGTMATGRSPMQADSGTVDRVEGRIAFLRTELKVTDQQSGAWNEFADALRTGAKRHNEMRQHMASAPMASMSARLEEHERLLNARLESTRSIRATLTRLRETLTDEQKRTLDELVIML